MTANTLNEILKTIAATYRYTFKDCPRETMERMTVAWFESFRDYSDEEVLKAFRICLLKCKQPPSIADLVDKIEKARDLKRPSKAEVWEKVMQAVEKTRKQVFSEQYGWRPLYKYKNAECKNIFIEALSEEEKSELMASMQAVPEETETPVDDPAPAVEEGNEETVAPEEAVTAEEPAEEMAEVVEETVEPTENPVEETMTENVVETDMETALDEPQPEEQQPNSDYGELLAAQNARFDSIESQLAALKETVEKVVANQDNKNFGYSPKANFDDDVQMSRSDAILQSYAPRRADQYK